VARRGRPAPSDPCSLVDETGRGSVDRLADRSEAARETRCESGGAGAHCACRAFVEGRFEGRVQSVEERVQETGKARVDADRQSHGEEHVEGIWQLSGEPRGEANGQGRVEGPIARFAPNPHALMAGDPGGAGKGQDGVRTGHHGHPFEPDDASSPGGGVTIADGVIEIDTMLGGWHRVTAGYVIEGSAPVLVETGSQSSVPVLLEQLGRIGLAAEDLAGVVVTHIHLDHAGGVGDVARAFPKATVYVHEKGARHLVDPTRLIDSASRVYGPLLDSLYGRLDPTPPERIHVLSDGEDIPVGSGRSLVAVDSPGHAKHHVALHDSLSGVLFAGDAVGVKLPDGGVLRPSTPPPDFDLDLALNSLRRFTERRPTSLALAHYGMLEEPLEILEQADGTLRRWAEVAETAFRSGEDIAAALAAEFESDMDGVAPEHREKLEVMNGVHSNAAGLHRWLSTREGPGGNGPARGSAS
jgi:glyoxylase-like metal-dependent hydrolase (beta-lactamase superfamily II)